MPEHTLRGCRVLVVEDEYMLADELRTELADADAMVVGPVGTLAEAVQLVRSDAEIDGAILDINLRGEMVFPVADLLAARGVRFLFATGYDGSIIPSRFADVMLCEKPINITRIARAIGRVIPD